MNTFSAGQVRRTIQRFQDARDDLLAADMNTFDDRLGTFVYFCTNDSVFSLIHNQLIKNPNANFDKWYREKLSTCSSMAGSARLEFPPEPDTRLSLMYQLILAIQSGKIDGISFFIDFFAISSSRIDDFIHAFMEAVIQPATRELAYRLEEISERLPIENSQQVSPRVVQVIHAQGPVIQQMAKGNGNIQTAVIKVKNADMAKLIEDLRREINELVISDSEKSDAQSIVDTIEREISTGSPNRTVIHTLLKTLPVAASIATIISAILAAL